MLAKFVNALRPTAGETEGTGTYPDGFHANALIRQSQIDAGSSLRASYDQDYLTAKKWGDYPRAHS